MVTRIVLAVALVLTVATAGFAQVRTRLTHSVVTVLSASSTTVLSTNLARNFLWLQNNHATQHIFCKWGGGAAVVNEGMRVAAAGGLLVMDVRVDNRQLNCIASGGNTDLAVSEGSQ